MTLTACPPRCTDRHGKWSGSDAQVSALERAQHDYNLACRVHVQRDGGGGGGGGAVGDGTGELGGCFEEKMLGVLEDIAESLRLMTDKN
jgi:hypothetical protein